MPPLQLPPPALRAGSVTTQADAAGQHVHPSTLRFREMPNKPGEGYHADVAGGGGQVHVFRNLTHDQQQRAGTLLTVHQKYPDDVHRPLSPASVQVLEQNRQPAGPLAPPREANGYPNAPPSRPMAYRGGQGTARYNRDFSDE
jgi:hypothetical protein